MKSPSKGSDGGKRPPKGKIVAQKRSRTGMPVSGEGDVVLSQPLLARLRLLLRFIPALVHYDEVRGLLSSVWHCMQDVQALASITHSPVNCENSLGCDRKCQSKGFGW